MPFLPLTLRRIGSNLGQLQYVGRYQGAYATGECRNWLTGDSCSVDLPEKLDGLLIGFEVSDGCALRNEQVGAIRLGTARFRLGRLVICGWSRQVDECVPTEIEIQWSGVYFHPHSAVIGRPAQSVLRDFKCERIAYAGR